MSEIEKKTQGQEMYEMASHIFPYFRSITGKGTRKTLHYFKKYIEQNTTFIFYIKKIPTGTKVYDWTIPKEWDIKEAYIEDEDNNHIIDIKNNNLHVLNYSYPVDKWVNLSTLKKYIYTQPNQPNAIPYVTSYYKKRIGFCMSEIQKQSLKNNGKYHMYIDSKLFDGYMNYGEVVIPGLEKKEVFFSTYICHPSMANNECSGPSLSMQLIMYLYSLKKRRYTYRFVFIPETIGSIAYLSTNNNLENLKENMIAGFNLSCVGDDKNYSMVESKYGDTISDKVLKNVLKFYTNNKYTTYSFLQRGSDERQYNSVGVDLPVVCFCRSKFGEYSEYHTSLDDMNYVSPSGFQGSYEVMTQVIENLERNKIYKTNCICEPQLGKRGLYPTLSKKENYNSVNSIMDFLAYADGKNDLIDISNIINVPIYKLSRIIDKLKESSLIKEL